MAQMFLSGSNDSRREEVTLTSIGIGNSTQNTSKTSNTYSSGKTESSLRDSPILDSPIGESVEADDLRASLDSLMVGLVENIV